MTNEDVTKITIDAGWLKQTFSTIVSGIADELSKGDLKIYSCGKNIIRIDVSKITIDAKWLNQAVSIIVSGIADKLTKGNLTLYSCGKNIIQIDVKLNLAEVEIGG